VIKSEFSASLL